MLTGGGILSEILNVSNNTDSTVQRVKQESKECFAKEDGDSRGQCLAQVSFAANCRSPEYRDDIRSFSLFLRQVGTKMYQLAISDLPSVFKHVLDLQTSLQSLIPTLGWCAAGNAVTTIVKNSQSISSNIGRCLKRKFQKWGLFSKSKPEEKTANGF